MFGLELPTAFYFMRLPLPRQAVFFLLASKEEELEDQLLRQLAGDIRDAFPFGHTNAYGQKDIPGGRIYASQAATGVRAVEPLRSIPPFPWLGRREAPQAWAEPEGRGSPRPSLAERREAERARRPADRPQGGTCCLLVWLCGRFVRGVGG